MNIEVTHTPTPEPPIILTLGTFRIELTREEAKSLRDKLISFVGAAPHIPFQFWVPWK